MEIDKTKVRLTLDGSELPIILAALLNQVDRLPEPNRTVCLTLHQRLLKAYKANFDWSTGKVAPSYATAERERYYGN